jgi:hypothetical protein
MGLRGKGATPLSKRALAPSRNNPWDAPGLSRAERVIAFCEDLTVTSGTAVSRNFGCERGNASSSKLFTLKISSKAGPPDGGSAAVDVSLWR